MTGPDPPTDQMNLGPWTISTGLSELESKVFFNLWDSLGLLFL